MPTTHTIAISVPSGSHHRTLLQPLREFFIAKRDWHYLVISPGAPWADTLFPASEYPRDRFSFAEIKTEKWNSAETSGLLRNLYQRYCPSLVLTTTTGLDVVDRPLLSIAKEEGIKTCTYIESWDNVWKMVRKGKEQVIPDHLIVWNEIMKKHLLREFSETSPERISVTGSPRLDLAQKKELLPSREEVFKELGLNPAKRLLHFSTVELYSTDYVARHIAAAKRRNDIPSDLQLLATVHPGGKWQMHEVWAEKYGFLLHHTFGRKESGPHPDFLFNPSPRDCALLMGLFAHEDLLVNFSSTVALEAMLMNTPVVGIMYGKTFDWIRWRKSAVVRDFHEHYADLVRGGGVRIVRNSRELTKAINDYLEHPEKDREKRHQSCEAIMTTIKGDASQKTFEVIQQLL